MFKRKPLMTLLVLLISQFVVSVLLGATVTYGASYPKAPQGLTIWGKDISGMIEAEAYEILIAEIPKAVMYKQNVYPLELQQTYQNLHDFLKKQYEISTGNIIMDSFEYLKRMTYTYESPEKLNKEEILPQLKEIAQSIEQPGKAAKIFYKDRRLVLEEGNEKIQVDIDSSWNQLQQSVGDKAVPLVIESTEVHPTTAELQKVKDPLGDYTTYFDPYFYERVNNIRLAAKAIDGILLPPGAEFSFNDIVGKRDSARGYLPALIFMGNKVVTGDGGGICQNSTTLYQAVKQARLQILERHSHSLPVSYIPKGEDATVAYGILDFRFRNDTQGYILISATTGRNWIRVRLFGSSDAEHPSLPEPDGYPVKPEDWWTDPK